MKSYKKTLLLLLLLSVLAYSALHGQSEKSKLQEKAVDTAKHYIGIRETKPNSSPIIDIIIKNGGGKPGYSWCMYFVRYCFDKASIEEDISNPLPKSGRCAKQLHYAMRYGSKFKVIRIAGIYGKIELKKGDILIWKHGGFKESDLEKDWEGHTGLVEMQIDDNTFISIEGNTNGSGSRNGDGVYRKTRKIHGKTFVLVAVLRYGE